MRGRRGLPGAPCSLSRRVRELLEDLLDTAAGRAEYADARHFRTERERIGVRDGAVHELDRGDGEGGGGRVRLGGAWGFAAVGGSSRSEAEAALAHALDVAAAQPSSAGAPLAPEPPARGTGGGPL